MRGVFVTGTGTEVGKTVVAAAIAHTLAESGQRVAVFKPAVTGLEEPGEPDHALLRRAAGSNQSDAEIAPYRYQPPASPHLAAADAGERIDPQRLRSAASAAAASADALVCEGVGGLLVPLCGLADSATCDQPSGLDRGARRDRPAGPYLVRDLALDLGLPLVVAASPGLGTINHTLLTLAAARAAGLAVSYVVLTPWPRQPNPIEASNRETIESIGEIRVKTLPSLDLENPQTWPKFPTGGFHAI